MASGTTFSVASPVSTGVKIQLTNDAGQPILIICTVANLPSAVAGYAVGCLAMTTDSGVIYKNSSATSASFSTTLSS